VRRATDFFAAALRHRIEETVVNRRTEQGT
jgi:hypothetical protein